LKGNRLHSALAVLALCVCGLPAKASKILFSDLGLPGEVYNSGSGWTMDGSTASGGNGESYTVAQLFTVAGSGSLSVGQVDLAVNNANGSLDTFYATIWTDNAGLPGGEVAGAYWSLSTSTTFGSCCGLVSVTGIDGVSLTGGQQYFMILGPLSLSDDSFNPWMVNDQNVAGLGLYSNNGGSTWVDDPGGESRCLARSMFSGVAHQSPALCVCWAPD
jgi:hypothetical protein